MLKINIRNIRVNSITNIGSLNIGKTIICKNELTEIAQVAPEEPDQEAVAGIGPAQFQTPSVGEVP